jgi:hypothetical protein
MYLATYRHIPEKISLNVRPVRSPNLQINSSLYKSVLVRLDYRKPTAAYQGTVMRKRLPVDAERYMLPWGREGGGGINWYGEYDWRN